MSLKLEVGKKYIDEVGDIVKIVYANDKRFVGEYEGGNLFSYHENGYTAIGSDFNDLIKEYKERIKLYVLIGVDKTIDRDSWVQRVSYEKSELENIKNSIADPKADHYITEIEVEKL